MPKKNQPEKKLQLEILKFLHEQEGGVFWKTNTTSTSTFRNGKFKNVPIPKVWGLTGMPDIAGVFYGIPVFLEVKLDKTNTTKKTYLKPHQKEKIAELKSAGATCEVVRSVDEVKAFIEKLRDEMKGTDLEYIYD